MKADAKTAPGGSPPTSSAVRARASSPSTVRAWASTAASGAPSLTSPRKRSISASTCVRRPRSTASRLGSASSKPSR